MISFCFAEQLSSPTSSKMEMPSAKSFFMSKYRIQPTTVIRPPVSTAACYYALTVAEIHRNQHSGPWAVDRGEDVAQEASPRIQEVFTAALGHHQAGRLNEAERLYQQILQADPHHADALHFLGVLPHQIGRQDMAVDLIGRAIAQNGRIPAFHNNLGNALKAQGKLQEAAASYAEA